jgi:hypothetical protein
LIDWFHIVLPYICVVKEVWQTLTGATFPNQATSGATCKLPSASCLSIVCALVRILCCEHLTRQAEALPKADLICFPVRFGSLE